MSGLPPIGRRGLRDWDEMLADLTAIETAPPPLNVARIWRYVSATGPVAPEGELAVEAGDELVVLRVDGTDAARVERAAFRGGWLWLQQGWYYLDLDLGEHHNVQVSGPITPDRRQPEGGARPR